MDNEQPNALTLVTIDAAERGEEIFWYGRRTYGGVKYRVIGDCKTR